MQVKNLFFLFFLVFASCKLQKKNQKTEQAQIEISNENTLLWKVSGNGLNQPSYIFGTMHLLCTEDAALSDSVKAILNQVNNIYFELDMDNMAEMMGAMTKMSMNDGKTLKDLLTTEEYNKVKSFFEKKKSIVPFSMMESFKPMITASTLMEEEMPCKNGISGIEMQMMEYNKKNKKKETFGLETVVMQLSVFDSIPYIEQAKMLLQYVDSLPKTVNETDKLVEAYKSQNLKNIESLMSKSEPGLEKYMDLLLNNRNKDWVMKLKNIMPKNSIIAAVGAGHLVGNKGLIELLKKEGYTLTPIKN